MFRGSDCLTSRRTCRWYTMVRNLPSTLLHPGSALHSRERFYSNASLPNIGLWSHRNRVCRSGGTNRHLHKDTVIGCHVRRISYPIYRRHPLGPILHFRGRLAHAAHLQFPRYWWSHPSVTPPKDDPHTVRSQYECK